MAWIKNVVVGMVAVVWAGAVALPSLAQSEGYTRYVLDSGTFGLYYPSDWVQEYDEHYRTVDLYFDDGGMFIYTPDALADWQVSGTDPESFLRLLAPDWGAVSRDVRPLDEYAYMLLDGTDQDGEPYTNFVFAGPVNGGQMVLLDVFVYGDMLPDYLADVLLVYQTMDASAAGAQPVPVSDDLVSTVDAIVTGVDVALTLSNYSGGWTGAVAELHAKHLIPAGGSLLFAEEYAFFTGAGEFYAPLARNAPRTDFVMTAKLTFTPSAAAARETCALGMRVNWAEDAIVSALEVGYTNAGEVFYRDVSATGGAITGTSAVTVAGGEQHTFTIIAIDARLNVYLDGELVLADVAVEPRAGSWGLGLTGQAVTALCEASDLWVYALD